MSIYKSMKDLTKIKQGKTETSLLPVTQEKPTSFLPSESPLLSLLSVFSVSLYNGGGIKNDK